MKKTLLEISVNKFFTVGYGGKQPKKFIELLQQNEIRLVVDVRLRPDRASLGSYQQAKSAEKGIVKLLKNAGIEYLSLIELGNLFLDYEDWRIRYQNLLEKAEELLLGRLKDLPDSFCLLCAEKNYKECHREQIANYLVNHYGRDVIHL